MTPSKAIEKIKSYYELRIRIAIDLMEESRICKTALLNYHPLGAGRAGFSFSFDTGSAAFVS
ncbi:hypothetical protein [Mesorhizobium sp. BE184]|uniref:hypothetical protein n=1 Tax=Mesorhizobium sp. BE184 TaxID=2817714 RepID=UPI00286099AD|nr:hypothetical protein [Mesorhizobium sp. BE184]MDR7033497.1 hypothetical protein [Mesorhizobium sp. BE184]